MRQRRLSTVLFLLAILFVGVVGEARAEQTIVFLRHGEKPSGGYGQLTCQGFNRSLALPAVLLTKYGTPNILYAPSPAVKITDSAGSFYYDRPLATLEPLAVRLRMDIWSKYGYSDIGSLETALITPTKDNTTIFVAWEHHERVRRPSRRTDVAVHGLRQPVRRTRELRQRDHRVVSPGPRRAERPVCDLRVLAGS